MLLSVRQELFAHWLKLCESHGHVTPDRNLTYQLGTEQYLASKVVALIDICVIIFRLDPCEEHLQQIWI